MNVIKGRFIGKIFNEYYLVKNYNNDKFYVLF